MPIEDLEAKPLLVSYHISHTVELELSDKFCKRCSIYSMSNSGQLKCLCGMLQ